MIVRLVAAALAIAALAAPAAATRHADLVYLQQFKARQKLLADSAKARELAQAPSSVVKPAAQPATPARADQADASR